MYRLAIWSLDLAVLAGWGTLGDEANTPPADSLLHLLLDHLCVQWTLSHGMDPNTQDEPWKPQNLTSQVLCKRILQDLKHCSVGGKQS